MSQQENSERGYYCSIEIAAQKKPACHAVNPSISFCPECGAPCCPVCGRHNVVPLSRVTGYIGDVSGFNEGKKQELKDRKRYAVSDKGGIRT